jgi:16S rRNA U1498 N3-methylase RsmE
MERASLLAAGFQPLHFPTNVLRVDTAALYGIAALREGLLMRVQMGEQSDET